MATHNRIAFSRADVPDSKRGYSIRVTAKGEFGGILGSYRS